MKAFLKWTILIPLISWLLFFSGLTSNGVFFEIVAGVLLILSVITSVHHSEVIAYRVGEPFGTIILAVAITIIEVSIIISLMLSDAQASISLARDTIFSATMLILNGIVGLSLFVGAIKFREQHFSRHSATIALVSLVSIIFFTLILPSYTTSTNGAYYSTAQLIFVSLVCLVIYTCFLFAQTVRHREYFLSANEAHATEKMVVNNRDMGVSLVFLLISLGIVVLLAKKLSPSIEGIIVSYHLPKTLVGVVIAAVILLPEGIAAIMAATKNNMQTSLNLALGSALASIGLTIPSVALISSIYNINIILGLDKKSILLLGLSSFIVILSLISGRSNIVYGLVLIINLIAFIFLIIYP